MKAAVIHAPGQKFIIEDVPRPQPAKGEVLVRVRAAGLCRSDLRIQDGLLGGIRYPHIPGHEPAGEIAEIGAGVTDFCKGDRVVCSIDQTCGKCNYCLSGRPNLCPSLLRLGFEKTGCYAQYAIAPAKCLVKLPDCIGFKEAAALPDAVTTMYHALKYQAKISLGERVLIKGIGGLGMQGIGLAKAMGAQVYCSSRSFEKNVIAKDLGADVAINTSEKSISRQYPSTTFDKIIDNIGTSDSIRESLSLVRSGGKVVLIGFSDKELRVNTFDMMMYEKELIGSRSCTKQDLIDTVDLTARGLIKPYVSNTYDFDNINQALSDLRGGKIYGRGAILFE